MTIQNGVIKSISLGYEDHGIMSSMLHIDYGGSFQGFGGLALDSYDKELKKRVPTEAMGWFVTRCMETVGVRNWNDLVGKSIRVKKAGSFEKVEAIGHFLEDKWFNAEEEAATLFKKG